MVDKNNISWCITKPTKRHMSRDMRFPTMWYVRPSMAQISLRICTAWSEPLLVTWIFYVWQATDQTAFGVSKLKRRLHRVVGVYTFQNATLLEITCRGSLCSSKTQTNLGIQLADHSSLAIWRKSGEMTSSKHARLIRLGRFLGWSGYSFLLHC